MQLTTPQLYALAVMAVLTIIVIGISYVSGLRTGQAAAQRNAQKKREQYIELYEQEKAAHSATVTDLKIARSGHWTALEQTKLARLENEKAKESIAKQARDLTVIQKTLDRMDGLVDKLLAKTLTGDDLLTLNLAARQLGITAKAHARSGTNKPNQAELAQQALKEIVARATSAEVEPSQISKPQEEKAERDEDGYLIPKPIDWIGDGKSTWERIDDEQRALGLPAAQCL